MAFQFLQNCRTPELQPVITIYSHMQVFAGYLLPHRQPQAENTQNQTNWKYLKQVKELFDSD